MTKEKAYSIVLLVREIRNTSQTSTCASGSVGGARPCQGRGRGFESRLALLKSLVFIRLFCFYATFYVVYFRAFAFFNTLTQHRQIKDMGKEEEGMSKYDNLWKWIKENGEDSFKLTYDEIEKIAGLPLDHSFLKYKKELTEYGYEVAKISMKEQTVAFRKVD